MPGPIDMLNYLPASAEARKRQEVAMEGELVCKMSASIPEEYTPKSVQDLIRRMDEAGVDKVFLSAWKMFSYHKRMMLQETSVDEVGEAVQKYPKRLVGLAGYNPFRIQQSLQDIKRGVRDYGFKGVYIHIYGFDIFLNDRRMYPLYALCEELQIPVSMQVGHVLEAMPSKYGQPIQLDEIVLHFPDLKLIGAHTGWPWCDELIAVAWKWDNIYFGVDAWMPRYLQPAVVTFINAHGRDKCIWGTNGLPFKPMLEQFDQLGLKEEAKRKLLWENAIRVFKL